jgi:hypothetical protein
MPCDDEREELDEATQEASEAWIDYETAWEKAKNDTEAAGWACGGEIGVGVLGGAALGALIGAAIGAAGGAVACIAGLFDAENSVEEADAAYQKYELADDAANKAMTKYYLCMSQCQHGGDS